MCIIRVMARQPTASGNKRSARVRPDGPGSVAFLLAQLGAHATSRFAARVAELGLSPAHAGLLRLIDREPGSTQQALADRLGAVPSRLVVLIDELEERGLVQRQRDPADRRRHALHLSVGGRTLMGELHRIGREHNEEICAGFDDDQRAHLVELLTKMAATQGVGAGVHPGYGAPER